MSWQDEFDDDYAPPSEIQELVIRGVLIDISWHNDVCPSFIHQLAQHDHDDEIDLRLWCHPAKPEHREYNDIQRFNVSESNDDLMSTDDVNEAIAALSKRAEEIRDNRAGLPELIEDTFVKGMKRFTVFVAFQINQTGSVHLWAQGAIAKDAIEAKQQVLAHVTSERSRIPREVAVIEGDHNTDVEEV